MNDKRLNEELSAYLDGESRDVDSIARLLKSDPEVARRHQEYAILSSALKALPPPEVHPAFATRVLAQARETRRAPGWLRPPRLAAGIGLTALVVGAGIWMSLPATVSVAPATPDPEVAAVLELRHSDEPLGPFAALWNEDLLDGSASFASDAALPTDEVGLATYDESMDSVVESIVWLASAPATGSDSEELDAMLGELDEAEVTVLRELLVEYAMEENAI